MLNAALACNVLCLHALFVACCSSSNDPDSGEDSEDNSCSSLVQVRRSVPWQRTMVDSLEKTPLSSSVQADEVPKTRLERTLSQASTAADNMAMDARALASELQGLDSMLHVQAMTERTLASSILLPARATWRGSRQQTGYFPEASARENHGAWLHAFLDTKRFAARLPSMAPTRPQAAWPPDVAPTAPSQILSGALHSGSLVDQRFAKILPPQPTENQASEMLQHKATERWFPRNSSRSILLSNSMPQQTGTRQQETLNREDLDEAVTLPGGAPNATREGAHQNQSSVGRLGFDENTWFQSLSQMVYSNAGSLSWMALAVYATSVSCMLICVFCYWPHSTIDHQHENKNVTALLEQSTAGAPRADDIAGYKPQCPWRCC